ncbi:cation:proton antiporter [Nocardioides sp. Iso805N]|uniref:cation:proton antiporter n=1 Tax=Nocardioides sp. Iso805N TaxID=1283287 RepID=UPI00037CEB57|nr:cation:proton antiporter [Nocardioides sp. Iso805N]
MSEAEAYRSLAWILGAAALAPLLLGLIPRIRLPEVVVMLALGMALGPYGFGLAALDDRIQFVSDLGLGMLFLTAGLEVDPLILRTRDGGRAVTAWLLSLGVALCWMAVLHRVFDVTAWGAIAIAMTSTALGTLLPLLRDAGLLGQSMGRLVMANGAVGEFGPVIAMSVFLTGGDTWGALTALLAFCLIAVVLGYVLVRHSTRARRIVEIVRLQADTTAQAPVRLVLLLLAVMLATSASFGLDVILGAFVAGAIIRMLLPPDHESVSSRLDAIGYGFLVPVFFVASGMAIDPAVILHDPGTVLFVFASILLIRGGSVMLLYRHLARRQLLTLGLFSATGLPIIVAVTAVAVESGKMSQEGQSIVVAAGMLTVLALPILALSLHVDDVGASGEPAG